MPRFPRNDIISLVGAAPRYDLAESVGPDIDAATLLASEDAALNETTLSYGTAAGDPRLRGVIAQLHGVDADDVVITVGGMHALFLLAFILCERGDEAIAPSPLFPLARNALEVVGADVRTLPLQFDQGYQVDVAQLSGLLTERTKLVSLGSPQNPSGVALRVDTIRQILDLMKQKSPQAYLLIDETYREAAYGDDETAASAVALDGRIVSVASLSKCHGAAGLRLGWAITRDAELRAQLVVGKFSTVASCSTIDEALALKVLSRREQILGERRRHLASGLERTAAWVESNCDLVEWVRPDAGALCCVRLKRQAFDDAAVTRFYESLAAHAIRVGVGTWFAEEARVFRIGFGRLPIPELERALSLLSKLLCRAAQEPPESAGDYETAGNQGRRTEGAK